MPIEYFKKCYKGKLMMTSTVTLRKNNGNIDKYQFSNKIITVTI